MFAVEMTDGKKMTLCKQHTKAHLDGVQRLERVEGVCTICQKEIDDCGGDELTMALRGILRRK